MSGNTGAVMMCVSAAVAFAVQKTDGLMLSWSMTPLGLAVLTWGISFYFGCKHLVWIQTALRANYGLLQLQVGAHPDQPEHPQHLEAAISGVNKALDFNIDKAQFYSVWQFRLLISGAVLFIVWHVLEMWVRTNAT